MPIIVEITQKNNNVTGSSMRNICCKLFEKVERPLLTIFQEMRPEVKVTVTRKQKFTISDLKISNSGFLPQTIKDIEELCTGRSFFF